MRSGFLEVIFRGFFYLHICSLLMGTLWYLGLNRGSGWTSEKCHVLEYSFHLFKRGLKRTNSFSVFQKGLVLWCVTVSNCPNGNLHTYFSVTVISGNRCVVLQLLNCQLVVDENSKRWRPEYEISCYKEMTTSCVVLTTLRWGPSPYQSFWQQKFFAPVIFY